MAKDSTQQAVAKRLRRQYLANGSKQRAEVDRKHPFTKEPQAGPVAYQAGSYTPKGKVNA